MKTVYKKILLSSVLFLPVKGFSQTPDSLTQSFAVREQRLADAIGKGDKEVWENSLHDSCLITVEDGSTITKAELVADIHPLPAGYDGNIKIVDLRMKLYGETAVLSFIHDETLLLFGQQIHTQYRQMDTWLKTGQDWKMVAMQLFEIPKNPVPVTVPDSLLAQYTGTYFLGKEKSCTVTMKNGKLYSQKNGRDPMELLAETTQVFFRASDARTRILFVRTADNISWRMLERRAGEDLVWSTK